MNNPLKCNRWRNSGLAAVGISLTACHAQTNDATSAPPLFGGQGATVEAVEAVDGSSQDPSTAIGPCHVVRPPGDRPLIDDFEDGDNQAFKVFEREGWWWSTSDGTEGAKLHPPAHAFVPETLPEGDRQLESTFAAHLSAAGQENWGAAWGTTLRWVGDGIRCPFNASRFVGVRFVAKGEGTVTMQFPIPATVPANEDMGQCESKCWDLHGKPVMLTGEWQEFVVPFEKLQQGGWGIDSRFDTERLLGIQFSAKTAKQPVDFWIDDLQFITEEQLAQWRAGGPLGFAATAALAWSTETTF